MDPAARIGPYLLGRELGRGGMGVVWEARHPVLGTPVALKLLPEPLADEEARARFLREARACAELRHPHVVRVVDAGEDRGRPWLVMDLLQGEDLARRLRRGPLPPAEAAQLAALLARALEHVHAQGVVHRDVKPGNVLLTGAGPVLIDFGLARDARHERERLTRTGELLGTPEFMAPEQAQGDPTQVGPPADVYALGATLHALLTGRPPFAGGSALEVLRRVLVDPPPSAGVEPRLDALVLRCLQKDPAARPDAAGLARELEAWLAGRARPGAEARSPARPWAAAVLLLGAAVAVGVVLRPRASAPQPTPASLAPPATGPVPPPAPPSSARQAEVRDLLQRRAWDQLVPATELLVAEAPQNPLAWRLRGLALLRLRLYRPAAVDDPARAETALAQANQLEPGSADGHALMALCRRELAREGLAEDPPTWTFDAERALALGRGTSELTSAAELGLLLHRLPPGRESPPGPGQAAELRAAADQARALAGDSILVHQAVGEAFLELFLRGAASLEEVLQAWERGLALDPADPVCLVQLGFAHKTALEQGLDRNGGEGLTSAALLQVREAMSAYERAIAADPDYWYSWLQRGYLRLLLNQARRAVPDLERACALHPGHELAAWLLAGTCSELGRRHDALFAIAECLARNPDHPEARQKEAELAVEGQRFVARYRTLRPEEQLAQVPALLAERRWGAIELLTARLVRARPELPRAWFLRGDGLLRRALQRDDVDPAWAQAALERACALEPARADARALLAICRAQRGDLRQASLDAARALELGGTALAWAAAARVRAAAEGPDRAAWVTQVREACQRSLAAGGDSPWTWYEVGGALSKVADARELHAHWVAATRAHPGDPYLLTMAGFALKELGEPVGDARQLEEACGWYTRALESDREYAQALVERGYARYLLGQASDALADLQQACDLRPSWAHAPWVLGVVHEKLGKGAEAVAAYRECLRRDANHGEALARLRAFRAAPPGRE